MCCALLYTRISNSRAQKHEFEFAVHNNSTSNKRSNNQTTKQLDEQTLWRSSHVFTLIFSPNLILTAAVKRALPASYTNEQTERTDGRMDGWTDMQTKRFNGGDNDYPLGNPRFQLVPITFRIARREWFWTWWLLPLNPPLCFSFCSLKIVPFRAAFVFLQINTNLLMFFQLI